jgi:hypothetical protein
VEKKEGTSRLLTKTHASLGDLRQDAATFDWLNFGSYNAANLVSIEKRSLAK